MLAQYALTFEKGDVRDSLRAAAERAGFSTIFERPSYLFICDGNTPFLAAGDSIVVGKLFTEEGKRIGSLAETSRESTGQSGSPFAPHWGTFAWFDARQVMRAVFRDPSGAIGVYRMGKKDSEVFVSDADMAAKLGLCSILTPDLTFAVHWMQFPFLRTRRTGVEGVKELLPGVRIVKDSCGSWSEQGGWRPARFLTAGNAIVDPKTAAAELRTLLQRTIGPQFEGERSVLQLSGGLDSSILAVCMSEAGSDFECATFATRSSDGDERHYARDAATRFGLQLHEHIEQECFTLSDPRPPAFHPATNPLLMPFDLAAIGSALLDDRTPVDGAGGDNIFCFITSAAPIIDALRSRGLRSAIIAAQDITAHAGCSWGALGSAALRKMLQRRIEWKEDHTLLNADVLLEAPERHPWLEDLPAGLPGKREHVEAIVHIQHFLDRGGLAKACHPLMAQPLLELCLRIPSWLWMHQGRDRAIARDAFVDCLPRSILLRRTKGSLEGMFHRAFERLRAPMYDMLISGQLYRHHILDRDALDQAFADATDDRNDLQLRITEMIALEQWLQKLESNRLAFSAP